MENYRMLILTYSFALQLASVNCTKQKNFHKFFVVFQKNGANWIMESNELLILLCRLSRN